jgi:hypothetical protein
MATIVIAIVWVVQVSSKITHNRLALDRVIKILK